MKITIACLAKVAYTLAVPRQFRHLRSAAAVPVHQLRYFSLHLPQSQSTSLLSTSTNVRLGSVTLSRHIDKQSYQLTAHWGSIFHSYLIRENG